MARLPLSRIGPDEAYFIGERDSFRPATVCQTGWPYIQHRGGPAVPHLVSRFMTSAARTAP